MVGEVKDIIKAITFDEIASQLVDKYSNDHEKLSKAMMYLNLLFNVKDEDEFKTILNEAINEFPEFRSLGGAM